MVMVSALPTRPTGRVGFTLIELLIAISVAALLMGLMMAAYPALQRSLKRARTATILATVHTALEAAGADHARNVSPVEHPLAGSAAPRRLWVRADPAATPPSATGEALRVTRLAMLASAQERALLDDDRFADPALPHFAGLPRARLRILGAACPLVTHWRDLPDPGPGRVLPGPYDASRYPDDPHLVRPQLREWEDGGFRSIVLDPNTEAWEQAGDSVFAIALGAAAEQLAALGAIHRPDPVRDPLLDGNRVRADRSPAAQRSDWTGSRLLIAGTATPYRLRGPAIYDAWQREILFSLDAQGAIRLESAGADGHFHVVPGQDGVIHSDLRSTAITAPDRDARADNIIVGAR